MLVVMLRCDRSKNEICSLQGGKGRSRKFSHGQVSEQNLLAVVCIRIDSPGRDDGNVAALRVE